MDHPATVLLVSTMDTKGKEALYVQSCLKEAGIEVLIIDAGIMGESPCTVSISRDKVARAGGKSLAEVRGLGHEGKALNIMISGAVHYALDLYRSGRIKGIIGLGGSMGTTLGTGVMREFPVGFPKVMISTMASRNTRPFVGTKDILMLHSVCDLSGLNRITQRVLRNGAFALAGMVNGRSMNFLSGKPCVALSTLGTSETCAVKIRVILEKEGYEVVVFHSVGAGGQAMEEMIEAGEVDALVDLSLHEIADNRFGGDYDAGPERGKSALNKGIPAVFVPGNIDFLVTGPLDQAKATFPDRKYHMHNAAITVVRTEKKEIKILAEEIARLCNKAGKPLAILVPLKGFSAFDQKGGPLHDPEAPNLFDQTLRESLKSNISIQSLPFHINDEEFALSVVDTLKKLVRSA